MTKKDYIISNTIIVVTAIANVIKNDIFKHNGKYCFVYPRLMSISVSFQTAAVGESVVEIEQSN